MIQLFHINKKSPAHGTFVCVRLFKYHAEFDPEWKVLRFPGGEWDGEWNEDADIGCENWTGDEWDEEWDEDKGNTIWHWGHADLWFELPPLEIKDYE